jgi:hypothetical protein
MRRIARCIMQCCLVGLVLSVLIAWSGALLSDPNSSRMQILKHRAWEIRPPAGWPEAPESEMRVSWLMMEIRIQDHDNALPLDRSRVQGYRLFSRLYGFPSRCLRATSAHVYQVNGPIIRIPLTTIERGIDSSSTQQDLRAIALNPIPFGLATNTGIYGAIAFVLRLLWTSIRSATRRRRAARNRCSSCGYPVINLDICPECGTPVACGSDTSAALRGPPR